MPCGTGEVTAELIALGALVTGIDPSEEALAVAREHVPDAAFFQAELHDIPLQLRRRRFSVVFAGEGTLSLVPDLAAWLSTVAAALRKGGRLVLCDRHPVADCIEPVGLRWRESYFERPPGRRDRHRGGRERATARGGRRAAARVEGAGRPAHPLRAARGREEDRLAWSHPMPTRTLVIFALAAAAFLAVASAGHAAPAPPRWCGTDEATADRLPDAVASYQLHAVYAIPSDGTDRYFQDAPLDRARPRRDRQLVDRAGPDAHLALGPAGVPRVRLALRRARHLVPPPAAAGLGIRRSGERRLRQPRQGPRRIVPRPVQEVRGLLRRPDRSRLGDLRRLELRPDRPGLELRVHATCRRRGRGLLRVTRQQRLHGRDGGARGDPQPRQRSARPRRTSARTATSATAWPTSWRRAGRRTRSSTTRSTSAATTTTATRARGGTCRTRRGSRT